MRASSSWSRALLPYEVQDIDDAQAADYLINRGMARPVAEEAVRTITGGRFALLLHVASAAAMKPIADMRKELDVATDSTLKRLGILPTHALFRALIAAGRVPSNSALDLLPEATLDALLGKNIIALHPDGAYTVHARHVESFLRQNMSNHASLGTSAAPMTPSKATALREVKRATSPEGKDECGRAEEL